MPNYKITIQYDGTNYKGWQLQPDAKTIQGEFIKALQIISGRKVKITSSGRTDAGVHALSQVANFWLEINIEPESLKKALNSLLPSDIRIIKAEMVPKNFNARFHAVEKTYLYRIYRGEVVPPFKSNYVYHFTYPLNLKAMKKAAKYLKGEKSFKAFTSHPSSKNMVKNLKKIKIKKDKRENEVIIELTANGFLRYMVRIIVGTLLQVGEGKIEPSYIKEILKSENRQLAGPTAPPKGLFLKNVIYPKKIKP